LFKHFTSEPAIRSLDASAPLSHVTKELQKVIKARLDEATFATYFKRISELSTGASAVSLISLSVTLDKLKL
jgi:hypothetical protein